jgi:hypothetical protein
MIIRDQDHLELEIFLKDIKDDLLKNLYRILSEPKEVNYEQ